MSPSTPNQSSISATMPGRFSGLTPATFTAVTAQATNHDEAGIRVTSTGSRVLHNSQYRHQHTQSNAKSGIQRNWELPHYLTPTPSPRSCTRLVIPLSLTITDSSSLHPPSPVSLLIVIPPCPRNSSSRQNISSLFLTPSPDSPRCMRRRRGCIPHQCRTHQKLGVGRPGNGQQPSDVGLSANGPQTHPSRLATRWFAPPTVPLR